MKPYISIAHAFHIAHSAPKEVFYILEKGIHSVYMRIAAEKNLFKEKETLQVISIKILALHGWFFTKHSMIEKSIEGKQTVFVAKPF